MRMPVDLSFDALRRAYREGSLRPRSLLRDLQARAAALNGEFHVYIAMLDEAQLEPYLQALEAQAPEALPLYGIPFAIKDNIDLAGVPTTSACAASAYVPQRSASAVRRLIELGAIPTGKTNLDQLATGLSGTRSPYGVCRSATHADHASGGSSSGSALAVALGLASFALGTDTAGSGRVPAAINGLIGCKPTRGLVSTTGMVPACRSLDCIAFFTRRAHEASELLGHAAVFDAQDIYARRNPAWNAASGFGAPARFRFGLPQAADLHWYGCLEGEGLLLQARQKLEALGGTAVSVDFAPFLEAARLLYEPAGVAERYAAFGDLMQRHPQGVLGVIHDVVGPGAGASAVQRLHMQQQLQRLKQASDAQLDGVDFVLTPTIPRACTLAELQAEPLARNSELGTYTNFMNLLDYAAVAVPSGRLVNGLPWGVTLFGRAFTDQYLLGVAQALQGLPAPSHHRIPGDRARVVVCGAHLSGLPLNHQLLARDARLLEATRSSPHYRLYALSGGPVARPAMVRADDGAPIPVEVWEMPAGEVASFLGGIAPPLGLGKVELADGRWETGFICEPQGLAGARDITASGGWRAWLAQQGI